eukprot:s5639_g2.t1
MLKKITVAVAAAMVVCVGILALSTNGFSRSCSNLGALQGKSALDLDSAATQKNQTLADELIMKTMVKADRSGHCRTSSASSRSQWALPDLSGESQIAAGTARPQPRVPDRSGHCRTSTASPGSQWALPDSNREPQIQVGTAGPEPRAPDPSGHCRTSMPDRMKGERIPPKAKGRARWKDGMCLQHLGGICLSSWHG